MSGRKLWGILIKTVRELTKMLVKFFRGILWALLVILVCYIPLCLTRPHPEQGCILFIMNLHHGPPNSAMTPRWLTQLLSLLSHPMAGPFQSILTPLTLQCLCLSRKGINAGLHSNLWERLGLCLSFHNNHRDLLLPSIPVDSWKLVFKYGTDMYVLKSISRWCW